MNGIKAQLILEIKSIINQRMQSTSAAIKSAEESKLNETKSSAGDKYETGRAMMQMEQEKLEVQLAKNQQLLTILKRIDQSNTKNTVGHGSLIITDQLNYFISIGIGKITLADKIYYAISEVSPIGKLLLGKKEGEFISFRNQNILIKKIL